MDNFFFSNGRYKKYIQTAIGNANETSQKLGPVLLYGVRTNIGEVTYTMA